MGLARAQSTRERRAREVKRLALAAVAAFLAAFVYGLTRESDRAKGERLYMDLSLAGLDLSRCERQGGPCLKEVARLKGAQAEFDEFFGKRR